MLVYKSVACLCHKMRLYRAAVGLNYDPWLGGCFLFFF
nr:MAG TPA: hypothetical protein [Caudoviricetes sp.]